MQYIHLVGWIRANHFKHVERETIATDPVSHRSHVAVHSNPAFVLQCLQLFVPLNGTVIRKTFRH